MPDRNTDRIIGELKEFKKATSIRLDKMEKNNSEQFDKMNRKIENLSKFRWRLEGFAGVGVLMLGLIEFIRLFKFKFFE